MGYPFVGRELGHKVEETGVRRRETGGKSKIKNQIAKLQSKIQSGFSHGLRGFHGFKFRPQKGSKKHKTFLTMINADFTD